MIWMIIAFLGTLKGLQQQILGPDKWEQMALDGGMYVTHILYGKLRVFSFYTDSGQYGASQAHTLVVAGIIALGLYSKKKYLFFAFAFAGLIGMMISGTRGAIAVPGIGFIVYLFLIRNFKIFTIGIIAAFLAFSFLKYTTIAQSNYQINRMRTSLDPNDPSLQMRLRHQQEISHYMEKRPIGSGVGSSGSWGLRFSPHKWISTVATDSWYVKIWVETGVVGLIVHFGILFYILIYGTRLVWYKIQNKQLKQILLAFLSGHAGIMLASYGNGVLGQLPTGTLLYLSWLFIFISPKIDKELQKKKINIL